MKQPFSSSHPKVDKKIDARGLPKKGVSGVPGYDKGSGTPSWVSKPAKAAERKAK